MEETRDTLGGHKLPHEDDPLANDVPSAIRRRSEQGGVDDIGDHVKAGANPIVLDGRTERLAHRKHHVRPAKCHPGLEEIKRSEHTPRKGREVFGNHNGNTLELADQDGRRPRVVDMYVDDVRPKASVGHMPERLPNAPYVAEV